MNKAPLIVRQKVTASQRKLLLKAEKELNEEVSRQIDIVYHSTAIALHRYHSWNTEQIYNLIAKVSNEIWNECGASNDISMIQMLYEETGVELMCEDKSQHWYEVIYLNSELGDGHDMNIFQWIQMRQSQKKWIPAQITACILMCLWRVEHWKAEGLGRLFGEIEDIKYEFNLDPNELRENCHKETDFMITEEVIGNEK